MADEARTPNDATRRAEDEDAQATAHADRPPTEDEERLADEHGAVSEDVGSHEREMMERGANVKGEGQITPD